MLPARTFHIDSGCCAMASQRESRIFAVGTHIHPDGPNRTQFLPLIAWILYTHTNISVSHADTNNSSLHAHTHLNICSTLVYNNNREWESAALRFIQSFGIAEERIHAINTQPERQREKE